MEKFCEECGNKLWIHSRRQLKNGGHSISYRCSVCKNHVTYRDEVIVDKNVIESPKMASRQIGPKILHLDIETAPMKGFMWQLWQEIRSMGSVSHDWFALTWVAKWHRAEEIFEDALPFHKEHYKKNPRCDRLLMESIWKLLDEADIIVAHNGNRFDIPKLNARFIYHGMKPPSPYKQVDTLKVAKFKFKFTSNKLQYLANFLGFGSKEETGGMQLWIDCLDGKPEAWDKMVKYNRKDVVLLEDVYTVMRPWIRSHPNFGVYVDDEYERCTVCGSTNLLNLTELKVKYAYTNLGRFELLECEDCGTYVRGRSSLLNKFKKKSLVTNVT